jgi:hypothetical protein
VRTGHFPGTKQQKRLRTDSPFLATPVPPTTSTTNDRYQRSLREPEDLKGTLSGLATSCRPKQTSLRPKNKADAFCTSLFTKFRLLPNIEPSDQLQVPLRFVLSNIVEQRPTLANHFQQSATTRIIASRSPHVSSHAIDPLREHSNLYISGTAIVFVLPELLDDTLLTFFRDGHVENCPQTTTRSSAAIDEC